MTHAIIGCGRVSGNHLYAARESGVEVSACFDIDSQKSKTLAQAGGIPLAAASLAEIWENTSIHSVSICTDHASHAALTIAALESGKNVLVEKPIAIEIGDGLRMLETARRTGRTLAVVSQHRYNPLVQAVREVIRQGFLGVKAVGTASLECRRSIEYYRDSTWRGTLAGEGGSTVINQFIHTLDILVWTVGLPIRVSGSGRRTHFDGLIETEDTFRGVMEFPAGLVVNISSTNCSPTRWNSAIQLAGSDGTIAFSTGHPFQIRAFESKSPDADVILARLREIEESADNRLPPTMPYYGTSHVEQFRDFIRASNSGDPLMMPPSEALRTLVVVKALYRAAELQRPFDLRRVPDSETGYEELPSYSEACIK